MNNTFSFNRFKNLLVSDCKKYFRNFSTMLIVFCSLPAVFWIFNLLFGSTTDGSVRFVFICIVVAIAMLLVPSKVYGKSNLSREGIGFAMLPASSLEKFISMFIYCAIVTPILVFFGSYLVDAFLSVFPFGGFEKPIHIYTINDLFRMISDSEGAIQMDDMAYPFEKIMPVGMMRTSLYLSIIQWAAVFMLGNMLFKKHKAGKTFACYLGISYVFSMIVGGVIFANSDRIEQWLDRFSDLPTEEMIHMLHVATIWGMVIGIAITALLLFFTYRKIQTQKY